MRLTYERPSTLAKRMGRWIAKTAARYAAAFALAVLVVPSLAGTLVAFGYHEPVSQSVPMFRNPTVPAIVSESIPAAQAEDVVSAQVHAILESKMNDQKDKVLLALAKCESGSVKEPEAALVWDSNHEHAIGKYQWQIKSVQHYVKKLYGQTIDRKTAIPIALNAYPEIPVDELTRKVVFEDVGIAKDWVNCSNKYGLPAKVDLIRELTK